MRIVPIDKRGVESGEIDKYLVDRREIDARLVDRRATPRTCGRVIVRSREVRTRTTEPELALDSFPARKTTCSAEKRIGCGPRPTPGSSDLAVAATFVRWLFALLRAANRSKNDRMLATAAEFRTP